MFDYIGLIPLFPAVGFMINLFFGRRISKGAVGFVACAAIGLSFVVSLLILQALLQLPPDQRSEGRVLYTWIASGDFQAKINFLIDPLSLVMMMVVSGVSFIIHVYSTGYMHDDPDYPRYFTYLNLFVFFMLILVSAGNFLLMFVGWEGVGLCSYFLIGFWYEKKSASDAGKKAFIVNRIGDYGFLLAIFLIFVSFGTLDFTGVFAAAPGKFAAGSEMVTIITLLLFMGATGKSAQLPLYTWLPDAMEGPTPVSALIHAATMVTAGVYMVARCNVLFLLAPATLIVVAVIGAATAIFAASIGLAQNDIKRVLAYSTISQLGYMFLACGVGAFTAGIFHLMTHAFFKALLFLGAGSVMHAMAGELNMQKMGGLKTHMPRTYWTFLIATLAISGIFPFAGFFSKDEILWKALTEGGFGFWLVGAIGAFLTATYMFRAVYLTFLGGSRVDPHVAHHLHESPGRMTVPLIALAVLSIVGGWIGFPIVEGGNRFAEFLAPVFARGAALEHGHHAVSFEVTMMIVSILIAVIGIALAYAMYIKNPGLPARIAERHKAVYSMIYNKYWVDEIYDAVFVGPIVRFSVFLWRRVDELLVDGAVNGVGWVARAGSEVVKYFQTGNVQSYAVSILVGLVFMVGYLLFNGR
ncbi:MAG TPA: NADH-quinone oxidoreductase subunit L [Thermodesulfobacteriota bacterium]|nr:NADH-quinone oxidoreductase subunit L [Thermodesulfobacteriota bacterium]